MQLVAALPCNVGVPASYDLGTSQENALPFMPQTNRSYNIRSSDVGCFKRWARKGVPMLPV